MEGRAKILKGLKELTKEDVQGIKFLLKGAGIGAGILEEIDTSLTLYTELEKLGWVTMESLDFLFQLLRGVGREDIISLLQNGRADCGFPVIPEIPRMVKNETPIDRKVLDVIAGNITSDWKRLARFLDLEESKIDEIDADYRKVYEKSIQSLLQWTKTPRVEITWKSLKDALSEVPRNDIIRTVENNFPGIAVSTPDIPQNPGYHQASSVTCEGTSCCTVMDSATAALDHLHLDKRTKGASLTYPESDVDSRSTLIAESSTSPKSAETVLTSSATEYN